MDYTYLINELNKASAFDLYRLYDAIGKELRNPNRINVIKQALILGMELSYFDFVENRLIKARLLEVKQKNALVLQHESNKQFFIPYSVINLDSIDTEIYKATASARPFASALSVAKTSRTLVERFDIEPYSDFSANLISTKLYRARSPLYRRQILQENIRWKSFDEIYKIYMLLHRSDLNISETFRQTF